LWELRREIAKLTWEMFPPQPRVGVGFAVMGQKGRRNTQGQFGREVNPRPYRSFRISRAAL
jgi:hypothetical protein